MMFGLLLLLGTAAAQACSHGHGVSESFRQPRSSGLGTSLASSRSRSLLSMKGRRCATASPLPAYSRLLERQHAGRVKAPAAAVAAGVQKPQTSQLLREGAAAKPMRDAVDRHKGQQQYNIKIHAHIVSVVDQYGIGFGDVSDAVLQQQITALNAAYATAARKAGVYLQFDLATVTRFNTTPEADMCDLKSEAKIKANLRTGDASTLNLYITDLSPCGVYGWSSWPWDIDSKGLVQDGVVVHHDTLPGGASMNYNQGATAIHEIGHWLGLYHTFEHGCEEPGDSVADTPFCQAPIAESCPSTPRDSCPEQPGRDPSDNYMSYSHDECLNTFTPLQLIRIGDLWQMYRGSRTSR